MLLSFTSIREDRSCCSLFDIFTSKYDIMKHISALLLFFPVLTVFSQALYPGDPLIYKFGEWSVEDKTAVVFADVCNVRKTEDPKAEVSGRLTIGTEVKIISVSSKTHTQNGITAPWVKISAGKMNGFAWGATLTKGAQKLDNGRLALWGLSEIRAAGEGEQVFASVRIAEKGMVIYKQDFEVVHADRPREGFISVLPAPLLDGAKNVIVFETLSEACGVYASSHYLLYSDTGLHFVGSGYSMGDSGVLHSTKEFVFPYPKEDGNYDYHFAPEAGHIFCVYNDGEYDEDCLWVETRKAGDFTWDGSQLLKACEE